MERLLKFIILLGFLVFAVYKFRPEALSDPTRLIYFSYCEKPVTYQIGSIDKRFNLSKDVVNADISQAADLWNQALGKELLKYDDNGLISINFVYDERQALNNQINDIQGQISTENQNLKPEIADYEKRSADFKQRLDQLNSDVSYWNDKGGAPPEEYDKLVTEQESLKKEAQDLNKLASSLNQSTNSYNAQVSKLNQTIGTFKEALVQKPEEGLFNGQENRIDIYFNINQKELIHTLAHELGHSLGLGHGSDPKSIMYPYTSQQISLSDEDVSAIENYCQERNVFEYAIQVLQSKKLAWNL